MRCATSLGSCEWQACFYPSYKAHIISVMHRRRRGRTRKFPAAQLTRMSSRPKRPTASRTQRSQSSAFRTSPYAARSAGCLGLGQVLPLAHPHYRPSACSHPLCARYQTAVQRICCWTSVQECATVGSSEAKRLFKAVHVRSAACSHPAGRAFSKAAIRCRCSQAGRHKGTNSQRTVEARHLHSQCGNAFSG